MNKKIAIIGAGDLGQQIAHYIVTDDIDSVVGYFDDTLERGAVIAGASVLGSTKDIKSVYETGSFDALLVGIGYKHLGFKKMIFESNSAIPFATFIHSSVVLDPTAIVESGAVVFPGCILDKNVRLGANVLLNIGCSISHDSIIGDHSFLSPRVAIAGFTTVGTECILGISSTVIDNVKICDGVRLGAGAVAVADLGVSGTYMGIPAKLKKSL